ncbi:MAG: hypothetical protein J6M62_00560 [Selenomonadaceae bacterium]|nr:hypothetical protein [Selenomonadaceae bacterium]
MVISSVLQKDGSRAVTIPKEMTTDTEEFILQKYDSCYFLIPKNDPYALLRQTLGALPTDTPFERNQPELVMRDF